jgi:hypothetical protein
VAADQATYRIVRRNQDWAVDHNGRREGHYSTKEAAFEAAIGAASNSIKDGFGITIEVPPRAAGEPSLGVK